MLFFLDEKFQNFINMEGWIKLSGHKLVAHSYNNSNRLKKMVISCKMT